MIFIVYDNTKFLIDNNKVIYSKYAIVIKPIARPNVIYIPGKNSNIGVIDL